MKSGVWPSTLEAVALNNIGVKSKAENQRPLMDSNHRPAA